MAVFTSPCGCALCGGTGARWSRRSLVASAGAAAALAAAGPGLAARPRLRIDVHHHLVPPAFKANGAPPLPAYLEWTPQQDIERMDACGITLGVTSLNAPGVALKDPAAARALARSCNEYAAKMAQDYPGRFGSFASLPVFDPDGAVAELDYAIDTLGADGAGLMTSYDGRYLTDPMFAPILAEMNRRKLVVFVHPSVPGAGGPPNLPRIFLEMPVDTARTIVDGLYNGLFARYPDIKFIFAHGGGVLPLLTARVDASLVGDPHGPRQFPNGVAAALSRFHFDVVNVENQATFDYLTKLYRVDQLMFGTDNPALPAALNARQMDALKAPRQTLDAVEFGNALDLMPSLKAKLGARRSAT